MTTKAAPPRTNGVVGAPPRGSVGGNRKKQKRRAKQAAKSGGHVQGSSGVSQPQDAEYDEDPLGYGDEDYEYSDGDASHDQYIPHHGTANGYSMPPPPLANSKKKSKQRHHVHHDAAYNPELLGNGLPPLPSPPPPQSGALQANYRQGRSTIWNTSSQQERQNIKDFWLSLSEDERKSLLKIEKEAVLRKMKQQQKHSCSCTVCGRKRTAIEEELEVLYEGYYEELAQYAHHDHPPLPSTDGMIPGPLQHRRPPHPLAAPPPNPHHKTSQLQEHFDEDDDYSDEEEEGEEEEEYSDDDYTDDEVENIERSGVPEFFKFGQNLTVKGILTPWLEKLQIGLKDNADNLLTVADDLLKNDGRKFIEMMEQLAERRMARENEAEYAAANPSHPGGYPPGDPGYAHEDPLAAGDDYDDDEASYDSQEEYDDEMDEEDEMVSKASTLQQRLSPYAYDPQGGLTEEERMQEGRRMFQIFAARMFEQRVLTAYKEKVAAERQQRLLEELEDETKLEAQREAKKQRDAQKKKDKKKQQQQAKAEEKAKREAEKAEEEARAREAEQKKAEEQRRKKEEQKRKKDEEKKKQDEERAKKEADRVKRQQEEQQRREETERKARAQKAAEKARKEEGRKREREEREAREKEVRDRKAQEEKEKKEREAKAKADREAEEREKTAQQAVQPPAPQAGPAQMQKRPSQLGMVAVPGTHSKQPPSSISSPHPSITTPAVPKAPTPAKPRQASLQGSLASSPKQSNSQVSSIPSKSSSPSSATAPQQHSTGPPRAILQKANNQQQATQPQHPMPAASPLYQQQIQPPPGMSYPPPQQQHGGFGGMSGMTYPGFPGAPGPIMHGNIHQRGPIPSYPPHGPPMGRFAPPGMNGMPVPPPGMMGPQGRNMSFPYDGMGVGQPPPGFSQMQSPPNHVQPVGQPPSAAPANDIPRASAVSHSRQHSASEKERFESAANQPIARPAPIQRPSSVKPPGEDRHGRHADVDDLSKHLGSSALLDDTDEPILPNAESRRQASLQPASRASQQPIGVFGSPSIGFGAPGSNWNTPSLPFGQGSGLGQQNWGSLQTPSVSGWTTNNTAFTSNSTFGTIGGAGQMRSAGAGLSRPLTIRLSLCQACKQLASSQSGESDGFHNVDVLLRQIISNRPMLDSPPTLREIEEICETEGDGQNGGGELHIRKDVPGGDKFSVKWTPDATTSDQRTGGLGGLGEIGSPMPNKSSLAAGFGAPGMSRPSGGGGGSNAGFQGLGTVGSPSSY